MANPAALVFGLGAVGILGYAIMGSANAPDAQYNGSAEQAYSLLAQLPPHPESESNLIGKREPEVTAEVIDGVDQSVTWLYRIRGKEFGRFVARVEPVDANHAEVKLDFQDVAFDPGEDQVLRTMDMGAVRKVVGKVTKEQVLAAIEGRPVDTKAIKNARLILDLSPGAALGSAEAEIERFEKARREP